MKHSAAAVNKRRTEILAAVDSLKMAGTSTLAELFSVSPLTIRRDLDYLAKNKMILRIHGGAASLSTQALSAGPEKIAGPVRDAGEYDPYKVGIAKAAADLIEPGSTIFVNSSSTALAALPFLEGKHITVITNNISVFLMPHVPDLSIISTGGESNYPKDSLTGDFALGNLSIVTASSCIMGFSGISPETGLTTANINEVAVNEMMLAKTSCEKIAVARSNKLGIANTFISGKLSGISTLITDHMADRDMIAKISDMGIKIILASPFYAGDTDSPGAGSPKALTDPDGSADSLDNASGVRGAVRETVDLKENDKGEIIYA